MGKLAGNQKSLLLPLLFLPTDAHSGLFVSLFLFCLSKKILLKDDPMCPGLSSKTIFLLISIVLILLLCFLECLYNQ